jgi:hypothetical protein
MTLFPQFESITLHDLQSKAALLDRLDVKFAFSSSILDSILKDCIETYQILCIDGAFIFDYTTTYYDTPTLLFYTQHHNGKRNRVKIRTRLYEHSQEKFLEVKNKTNKGKTIKSRMMSNDILLENEFLKEVTGFGVADLKESLISRYSRITLLHKENKEKITFDIHLKFEREGKKSGLENIVIAELKSEKPNGSCFFKIMKKHRIKSGALSKYCLGILQLEHIKKYHNFKPLFIKLSNLNKIAKT